MGFMGEIVPFFASKRSFFGMILALLFLLPLKPLNHLYGLIIK